MNSGLEASRPFSTSSARNSTCALSAAWSSGSGALITARSRVGASCAGAALASINPSPAKIRFMLSRSSI